VVVAVDQVTKSQAEQHLTHPVHLLGPLGLSLTYNSGLAFSILTGHAPVVAVIALALTAVLLGMAWRTHRTAVALALGLALGGALGNLSDRLFRGHGGAVVDFVSLRYWPTFNVADACVTVGVILLIVLLWRRP
jgi:signal peptidase II